MPDRVYAIGDIHGHLDQLKSVHHWIENDRAQHSGSDVVVHVGDLTDRGPDSAGVIQFLIDGLLARKPWVVLRGNHDRMMSLYLGSPPRQDPKLRSDYSWLHHRLGGLTTLASYGVLPADETNPKIPKGKHWLHPKSGGLETLTSYGINPKSVEDRELAMAARAAVPDEHQVFLAELDTVFRTKDALFVHAGIKPGVAIEDQVEDDLIWIREPFLSDMTDHGPLIVHGHTPVEAPTHYGNRINIDSGVAFGGPLSVVVLEGSEVWNLKGSGREPLLPTLSAR